MRREPVSGEVIINDTPLKDYRTLLSIWTNPWSWGWKPSDERWANGESRYHWYFETRYPATNGALLDFFSGGVALLGYTGRRTNQTWITLDCDAHDGQTDTRRHMMAIMDELGIDDPFSFPTPRGWNSIIRFDGCMENRKYLVAFAEIVKRISQRHNAAGTYTSTAEVVGLPGEYRGRNGKIGRIPRIQGKTDLHILSTTNLDFRQLLALLRRYDVLVEAAPTQKGKTAGRRQAKTSAAGPTQKGKITERSEDHARKLCPDARQRMISAKCAYVREHKRLPAEGMELVEFYEANGYARGDRDDARLRRAEDVLTYARSAWIEMPSAACLSFDQERHEEALADVGRYVDLRQVKGVFRCGVSLPELAAYSTIALHLSAKDGFASRDGIMGIMNGWKQEGHLPAIIDGHKMSAFRKALVGFGYLTITREFIPPGRNGSAGVASCYARGGRPTGRYTPHQKPKREKSEKQVRRERMLAVTREYRLSTQPSGQT